MDILAPVIVPPHLRESGARRAALELSAAVAEHPGVAIHVALMCDQASTRLHGKATVLCRRSTNTLAWTKPFLPNRFRTLFYRSDIPTLVRSRKFDVIHLHNLMPALEAERVASACVESGLPYVLSTHGIVEVLSGGAAYSLHGARRAAWRVLVDRPLRRVFKHAHRVLAMSPAELPLLEAAGVEPEKVVLAPNAVDPNFLRKIAAAEVESLSERLHIDGRDPEGAVCVFLGNHTANKGVNDLLEAFSGLDMPYTLVVAGERRDEIDYDSYLADRRRAGLIRVPGSLDQRDVQALLHLSDVLVFPTRADTYPLTILEAMAYGTAIVSTTVGGIPHQVDDRCAVLVPPGAPDELRRTLANVLTDRDRLRAMKQAALDRSRGHIGWERSGRVAVQTYREVTAGG